MWIGDLLKRVRSEDFGDVYIVGIVKTMNADDFKKRTKDFTLRIVDFVESLPQTRTAEFNLQSAIKSPKLLESRYNACPVSSGAYPLA